MISQTRNEKSNGAAGQDPRISLQDQAYEEIKRRIITGVYAPGQYLNEKRISEDISIGRTPVHQALDRLASLDLIEIIPRKGVIVTPISFHHVLNLNDARELNEPRCAALAAERATEHEIAELDRILEQSIVAMNKRDLESLILLDRDFHETIADASGNPILANIMKMLHERSLRVWFISLNDQQHLERVYREHAAIIVAIKKRDAALAAEAMHAHIQSHIDNISHNKSVDGLVRRYRAQNLM